MNVSKYLSHDRVWTGVDSAHAIRDLVSVVDPTNIMTAINRLLGERSSGLRGR